MSRPGAKGQAPERRAAPPARNPGTDAARMNSTGFAASSAKLFHRTGPRINPKMPANLKPVSRVAKALWEREAPPNGNPLPAGPQVVERRGAARAGGASPPDRLRAGRRKPAPQGVAGWPSGAGGRRGGDDRCGGDDDSRRAGLRQSGRDA